MSEIFITGATGVIGWRSVARLVADGHRVTGLTRSARGRERLTAFGARAVAADVYDAQALREAIAGSQVVINLLTHVPTAERILEPEAWEEHDRLRREASAAIAEAAERAGAERLVQESIAFLYADGADDWLDEDAPLAPEGPTVTALTAERNAIERFAGDTVVLRFGLFMGPDSGLTLAEIAYARSGSVVRLGDAAGRVPTIWLDDAADAVAAALDVAPGRYNVVDDDPPTRPEMEAALAGAVGRSSLHVEAVEAAGPRARSLRVSNRRLRSVSGWAPAVRAGVEGWDLIVRERAAA